MLALESNSTLLDKGGWLGKSALVEALDAYIAGLAPSSGNKAMGTGSNNGLKPNNKSSKFTPKVLYKPPYRGDSPQTDQKSGGRYTVIKR